MFGMLLDIVLKFYTEPSPPWGNRRRIFIDVNFLINFLAIWVILHAFLLSADFFKINFFEKKNQKYYQCQF